MTFFVFPSGKNPQFYLSNNRSVLVFFIKNFLFSKNGKVQFLMNVIQSVFPPVFISSFLRIILTREIRLPDELSDSFDDIREFIKHNRELFFDVQDEIGEINFIIRKSKWQRTNDKLAVILFKNSDMHPFAVVKAGSKQHKNYIELEFNNTRTVYAVLKNSKLILIPEPIAFHASDKTALYFERAVEGTPFSDYLKLLSGKKRMDAYTDVLLKCREQLITFNFQEEFLSPEDFVRYFYQPLDLFGKTGPGKKYSSKLRILKAQIDEIRERKLRAVWMHGDLWTGSILYNGSQIAIIDWEFFSVRGVPLWDFFLLVFHFGAVVDYFSDQSLSEIVDGCLLDLAVRCRIDQDYIPVMFQSYILFNIQNRDTDKQHHWLNLLEHYWKVSDAGRNADRLL